MYNGEVVNLFIGVEFRQDFFFFNLKDMVLSCSNIKLQYAHIQID